MTELTTIDTNNYAEMAKAMGMANEAATTKKQGMFLARLRINHSAILGAESILVKAGTYKLEIPDGPTYYAESAIVRPFMQRFMYKKFVMGSAGKPNRYVKTVMADTLNMDLKDNDGGYNCGKPAGWIEDYASLPEATKELIKSIKRVRVVLGNVELINPKDVNGNPVELDSTPFIWEVENRDAFKSIGTIFTKLGKMRRLPPQHTFTATTAEQSLPNGNSFYLPETALDLQTTLELDDATQETLGNFLAWVTNYNQYISNAWDENAHKHDDVDKEGVEEFIDITEEDFA